LKTTRGFRGAQILKQPAQLTKHFSENSDLFARGSATSFVLLSDEEAEEVPESASIFQRKSEGAMRI